MPELILSQLAIYPVKSLAQISLQSSRVERFGLQNDRRWMLVDANGRMITQRQQSRMCLIQAQLTSSGIRLNTTGRDELQVAIPSSQITLKVSIWNDQCNAYDSGDEAAEWLSDFLGVDCRLVYFPDNEVRALDPDYAQAGDITAFSDGFPLLLISQASLDDLNSRLPSPIPMARFRPNLVVEGCEPFAEDNWKQLRIGDISLRVVKPCSRCVIPSIDIETGERGNEPTRTLVQYRKRDKKIFFGQNVIADSFGEIQVGMPVEVLG